jgi:SAM-dependent methyltransferase
MLKAAKAFLKPGAVKMTVALSMLRSGSQRKYLITWLRSFGPAALLDRRLPWIVFEATDFLADFLNRERQRGRPLRVFEYGSGGSTLFWLAFGAAVVSVEHDPQWYARLRQRLDAASPVDYRLVLPEPGAIDSRTADIADPGCYLSDDASFRGCTFRDYVSQIDPFPDGHFDVILIDGRARPACIRHSVDKVRPGGLLVLDNADRPYYTARTQSYLSSFARYEFRGPVPGITLLGQTDIYVRDR